MRHPENREGVRFNRRMPFFVLRSRSAMSGMTAFTMSFALSDDQPYSIGLHSGAHVGSRLTKSHDRCVLKKKRVFFDVCAPSPSRKRMSFFPLRWRRSCLTYEMISSLLTARFLIAPKKRGFLPRGVQTIVPIIVRFFHPPAVAMIGVCPLRAQVRLTLGRSETPDSSRKPRSAPVVSPFFGCGERSSASIV